MEKLEEEGCADKQSWQIFPKNEAEKVNIGFYLPEPNPSALEEASKEKRIAMKKDILLGQLKIDEAKINAEFFDNFTEMTNENIIGAIDTAQEHYSIQQVLSLYDFFHKKIRINLEMQDSALLCHLKFLGGRW